MKRTNFLMLVVIFVFVMSSMPVFAQENAWIDTSSKPVDSVATLAPTAIIVPEVTPTPTVALTTVPTVIPESTTIPTDSPTKAPEAAPPGGPASTPNVVPTTTPLATTVPTPAKKGGLAKAKREAKEELKNFLNLKNYDKKEKDLIKSLLRAANKDIDECKSVKEVKEYVKFAKRVLRDIPKKDGVEFGFGKELKFNKRIIKVKRGAFFKIKVTLSSSIVNTKTAKQLKWKINKKGKKVIKFVKKSAKLKGKLSAKVKSLAKGRAKVMCSLPNGKKASCTVIVW